MSKFEKGVRLYSYQNEPLQGIMTLQNCLRASVELGARRIEIPYGSSGPPKFSRERGPKNWASCP